MIHIVDTYVFFSFFELREHLGGSHLQHIFLWLALLRSYIDDLLSIEELILSIFTILILFDVQLSILLKLRWLRVWGVWADNPLRYSTLTLRPISWKQQQRKSSEVQNFQVRKWESEKPMRWMYGRGIGVPICAPINAAPPRPRLTLSIKKFSITS